MKNVSSDSLELICENTVNEQKNKEAIPVKKIKEEEKQMSMPNRSI
jgi:hypothetical protein